MSEEPATLDLVELMGRFLEAGNRRDFDVITTFCAPDAVWESMGMATSFEGIAAIRGFFEDFIAAYEDYRVEPEEILDLGNGITFSVIFQQGRPVGSAAHVQMRFAGVTTWVDGLIERNTNYTDIDEGRAAAERLARERG
jgi:ketosteroid isomerase-like protein